MFPKVILFLNKLFFFLLISALSIIVAYALDVIQVSDSSNLLDALKIQYLYLITIFALVAFVVGTFFKKLASIKKQENIPLFSVVFVTIIFLFLFIPMLKMDDRDILA